MAVPEVIAVWPPPPEIVLQPKPVPLVQVRAFVAPLHDGTACPLAVVAVSAPNNVFAESAGSWEYVMPVRDEPLPVDARGVKPSAVVTSEDESVTAAVRPLKLPTSTVQLKPLPLVHCSVEPVAAHDGTESPEGDTAVKAPRSWLAESAGSCE